MTICLSAIALAIFWLTGLPGVGKTTLAKVLKLRLDEEQEG